MNTCGGCLTLWIKAHKRTLLLVFLPLLSLFAFVLSLALGSGEVDFFKAISDIFQGKPESTDARIILYVRLPRALAALFGGAALAVSGVIIQGVLNNPMAAPNVIGVNAGAGFFVIIAMAALPSLISVLPLAAFLGALFAMLIIYAFSSLGGAGRVTVTLVGIAVGSILTAGINTVKVLFPDSVYDVSGFLIGGLGGVGFHTLLPSLVIILPVLACAVLLSAQLDVLSLGEEVAAGLGINPKRRSLIWLSVASALAGAAVSYMGLVGFVGLIAPHIMRRLVGSSHRQLLPLSAFGGALLLLLCDTLARLLFYPYELPVGIILSLLGGPFFIMLVLGGRGRKND